MLQALAIHNLTVLTPTRTFLPEEELFSTHNTA